MKQKRRCESVVGRGVSRGLKTRRPGQIRGKINRCRCSVKRRDKPRAGRRYPRDRKHAERVREK